MRTATQLVLVLMGGGALTAGAAVSMEPGRACREARARNDPQTEAICRANSGYLHTWHSHYGSHVWFGSTQSTATTSSRSVSRGGFGLFGMHFSGLHG
jgi:hypothetical protein